MKGFSTLVILACAVCTSAHVLRGKPEEAPKAVVAKKAATPKAAVDVAADVLKLHKQLETISVKLDGMLNAKDGALAHAKVGPAMQVFLKELTGVLAATAPDKKMEPALALLKLNAAKAGLASLMGDLNNRQTALMKEDNAQRESLLLGVLMTKQKEPMDEQLKIMKDDDFAPLEVCKALLAKHDAKLPLYVQAATYLDKNPKRKLAPMQTEKSENPLEKVQHMLESKVSALEHEFSVREGIHKKKAAEYAAQLKGASKSSQHRLNLRIKKEDRAFKKFAALRKHDITAMKDAVAGVKKGDMKAVARARDALTASLKAMQQNTSGFLYLIQMGHRLMKKDCPYCAAQCVDKCHTAGKPYVTCLTDCADAGK